MVCCEALSGLCWTGQQRPGGSPGAAEVVPLLERGWALAPASMREVRVRGDHRVSSEATLTWLEDHRAEYASVARLTAPLKRRLAARRSRRISERWAAAETQDQAGGWTNKRRIIVVRKRLQPSDPQPTRLVMGRSAYHAYVTTLDLQPEHVWRFSNDRARLARLIKDLTDDDALGQIPTRRFDANALDFEILRVASTLVVGFQTLGVPEPWRHQATWATSRTNVFMRPAVLARPQGRPACASRGTCRPETIVNA